jgi:hypothetical protein
VLIQYGGTALYNVAIVAVGLVALVPLLFVFLLGATLASRKNSFNVFLTSFLLVVWMVAIIAVGVLSLRFAPEIQGQVEEMKSVPAVEERRSHSLDDFDRIHADGIDELIVRQGERFAVSSEGASADLQKLNLDVKDGELRIIRNDSAMFVGQDRAARVVVSMPELKNLRLDGLVKAKVEGFKQANMFLDLGGASKAELGVDISDRLVVKMDGLSELVASGSARVSEVVLGGSSEYDASSLVSGYGTFRLEGTAKAKVNASDYIRIETFGLSHAYYSGSAKVEAFARDMSRIEAR